MSFKSILKSIIIVGSFLIPFTPLLFVPALFFPFITGKAFFFRIIVEIIFAAWILLFLMDRSYLPHKSKLFYSVVVFLIALLIATIFGVNSYASFWSSFERMEGFLGLLHLGMFFVVLSSVFNKTLWNRFFYLSLFVSAIVSIYGIFQLSDFISIDQGDVRVDGTLGNAIYLAVYLLFHIFISLFYFFRTKDFYRYTFLGLVALETVIVYFTASRGVILGLIGGTLVTFVLIFFFEKNNKKIRKISGAVLLGVILLVFGFFLIQNTQFVKQSSVLSRFSELSFSEIKNQGRYYIWPIAIESFKQRPILGYGQENFLYAFSKNYNPALFNQEPWFDRVHNIFLDWLIAGGIIGLLAYLAILFFLFRLIWRSEVFSVTDKSVLTGLLAAYLFQGMFVFDNLISYIMFFSVAGFVLGVGEKSTRYRLSFLEKVDVKKIQIVAVSVVALALIFSLYFFNIKPLLANRALIHTIDSSTDASGKLSLFQKVFEYDTFGNYEALIQLLGKTLDIVNSVSASEELKNNYFLLTKQQIELQTANFPNDARLFLVSGSFFNRIGFFEEALKYLERAKELAPKKQDVYLEIGFSEFSLGNVEEALENFEFAVELEPRNTEGLVRQAVIFLHAGEKERAESILEKLGDEVYYNDRLLNAFVSAGQYNRVLEIWKRRVEEDPDNIKKRQALVGAYLTLGMWSQAVTEIEMIIKLDASFKETGEAAIREIRAGRGANLVGGGN